MKWDFRHHLLLQIEMLRADISHEEFSKNLGDITERCLGEAARELRTDKGLTQSDVAKRALVSVLWIKRLETNQLRTNYTIRRLDQIAGVLGVELYDLYKRASEMAGLPPWLETEGTK